MYVYIVAWSGGLEAPSYEVKGTEGAALKLARDWTKDAREGVDSLDILRMDLRSPLKLQRRRDLSKQSQWDD